MDDITNDHQNVISEDDNQSVISDDDSQSVTSDDNQSVISDDDSQSVASDNDSQNATSDDDNQSGTSDDDDDSQISATSEDDCQSLTSGESPLYLSDRPHPWLVITQEDSKHATFYNVSEGTHHTKKVPELQNKHICDGGGSNGWLYLEDCDSKECSLLNIATMENVSLPSLAGVKGTVSLGTCFVTSDPTDPDCRVVLYDACVGNHVSCKVGDGAFVLTRIERGGNGCIPCFTVSDGKVYGLLMGQQELVVSDTIEESYRFKKVGIEQRKELMDGGGPLVIVECGGEILLVVKRSYGGSFREFLPFHVYRANFSKKEWVRVRDIGRHAIFLQMQHRGYSCSTEGLKGVKQNCIYFTLWDDAHIHVFDLEDESFSVIVPCASIYPHGSKLSWVIVPPKPIMTEDVFDPRRDLET